MEIRHQQEQQESRNSLPLDLTQAARQEPVEEIESLLLACQEDSRKRRRRMRIAQNLSLTFGGSLLFADIIYFICLFLGIHLINKSKDLPIWAFAFGVILYDIVLYSLIYLPWGLNSRAAERLAEIDDVRAIGPLAEVVSLNRRYEAFTCNVAEKALIKLLPKMRATDAPLLSAQQRQGLYTVLRISANTNLILAILKALEQIGDARALPHVARLAAGKGKTGKQQRVLDAAQACLPFLSEYAEQHRASKTFLRASAASELSSEALLRPAADTNSSPPDQLLRPGRGGDEQPEHI